MKEFNQVMLSCSLLLVSIHAYIDSILIGADMLLPCPFYCSFILCSALPTANVVLAVSSYMIWSNLEAGYWFYWHLLWP